MARAGPGELWRLARQRAGTTAHPGHRTFLHEQPLGWGEKIKEQEHPQVKWEGRPPGQ